MSVPVPTSCLLVPYHRLVSVTSDSLLVSVAMPMSLSVGVAHAHVSSIFVGEFVRVSVTIAVASLDLVPMVLSVGVGALVRRAFECLALFYLLLGCCYGMPQIVLVIVLHPAPAALRSTHHHVKRHLAPFTRYHVRCGVDVLRDARQR
jgi:hypothetical protein